MCGIGGVAAREPNPGFVEAAERMAAALRHRGPDSHAVKALGACVLANTRLSIVDLSDRGRMPMCNEDESVWITYNGECYNADELRPGLIARGHRFRSSTDTEVILHLYEEYGEACVEKLRGMFAFAVWDSRRRHLLLARDRLGIKPLYYSLDAGRIVFGSEIKSLLASGLIAPALDRAAISAFLALGHIPPPWTPIQNVQPLEPGCLAVWHDGNIRTRAYWQLPFSIDGRSAATADDAVVALRETLVESCRRQLMADVPIALFLSGGIDSAAVAALMRRAGGEHLTALTVVFAEQSFDESSASRRTAEILGIPWQPLSLSASDMQGSLDHALWAMDMPTMDGLNVYWISRAAAQAGFKVALSGQGGDELFGGYASIAWFSRFARAAAWLKPIPRCVGRGLFDHSSFPFRWRKLGYLVGADDPFVASQMAVRVMFLDSDVRELLAPSLAPRGDGAESAALHRVAQWAASTQGRSLTERIALLDFPAHLEARLLRDGDAMSMAHSLEVRPVFLDHAVVEQVLSTPAAQRLQNKKLLLAAVRDVMPKELYADLLARPKRTFTLPFSQWLSRQLRPVMEETFASDRLAATGVFQPAAVDALWRRYLREPAAVGWARLWAVFVLARWCEIMQVKA